MDQNFNEINKYESILTNNFELFLKEMGLPYEGVLVTPDERIKLKNNLPQLIRDLPPENKMKASYLSRFVASSAIGLYDASLNYLWNEVIVSLRKIVVHYGIDIFFDEAIGSEKLRENYTDEKDLVDIKDQVLLDTCKKLEIITPHLHQKLSHILYNRNFIGASHPNEETISTFELLGMVNTCVVEVINSTPSSSAMYISKLLKNIKSEDIIINTVFLDSLEQELKNKNSNFSGILLKSLFSIFMNNKTTNNVKNNIIKIVKVVWIYAPEIEKYQIGNRVGEYLINLETENQTLAENFLDQVNGIRYKSDGQKSNEVDKLLNKLYEAHISFNNFYTEGPIAKDIEKYIKKEEDILKSFEEKLIKVIIKCRIGNGLGHPNSALIYYNNILGLLNEHQIKIGLKYIVNNDIAYIYNHHYAKEGLKDILKIFNSEIINDKIKEVIEYIFKNIDTQNDRIFKTEDFKRIYIM